MLMLETFFFRAYRAKPTISVYCQMSNILRYDLNLQSLSTGYVHAQISCLEFYSVGNRYSTFVNENG